MTTRTWQSAIARAEAARAKAEAARASAERIKEALDRRAARVAADRLAATWTKEPPQ